MGAEAGRSCPARNASGINYPTVNPFYGCSKCFDWNPISNPIASFIRQAYGASSSTCSVRAVLLFYIAGLFTCFSLPCASLQMFTYHHLSLLYTHAVNYVLFMVSAFNPIVINFGQDFNRFAEVCTPAQYASFVDFSNQVGEIARYAFISGIR